MKVGKISVASIVLLIFGLITFFVKHFYPLQYPAVTPYLDGGLIGATLVFVLYYFNIYFTAWSNNRKEARDNTAA